MSRRLAFLALAALLPLSAAAQTPAEIDRRVEDLLGRMTLEEKIGQLHLGSNGPGFRPDQVRRGFVGGLMNFNDAPDVARVQAMAREGRNGIPLLIGLDILQGFRTIFPVPLAQAASFDPAMAREAAAIAAREASAAGVNWTFAPMADLSRDPRWGRAVEGSGEDPLMNRLFTAARVEGFRAGGLATSLKHFVGYGGAIGGRDYDVSEIGPGDLRDLHLPAFKSGVEAGAETVMASLNALDGVPGAVNEAMLNGVLRRDWGFRGFVVSDWDGVKELMAHGVAADGAEASRRALMAGVDMDMESGLFVRHLPDEIAAGRVPVSRVDEAARRILRIKMEMGLFGRPDPDPVAASRAIMLPESRAKARAAARDSMVLLTNRGALPFAPGVRSIALVGAMAGNGADQLGPHAARGWPDESVTIRRGLEERAGRAGVRVAYAPGCDAECRTTEGFAEAVRAAGEADVVVAVMGEPRTQSGEGASRVSLDLPGRQGELLDALIATGKPVVVVLMTGRPLLLGPRLDRVAGLVMAWYPGTEGGPALAELLFGDAAPSGRLPVSWPRHVGQVPLTYNRLPSGRPSAPDNRFTLGYMDESLEPLFPFGFGLSYTAFAYSDLTVLTPRAGVEDEIRVRVRVTNTGTRAGREVAQLYVRDPVATRSRPVRELKAFEAVRLEPGESREVTFRVAASDLGFHLTDGTFVVEPGAFQVWAGGDARAALEGRFEVVGGLRRAAR
ncbi:glycoside hydrolase family 3 N-terminal domain-containing protein [Salinarimonas soli]|uniref:Beta-D-glucoside glucohydrolase n=1 Tax=Salinarimonas soli TaxID=1638099 RepID=A0A5B2VBJ5_9HYPH|nr:glycoside hydrolase family 3 N-terminal domain-containing protein [Salinarimonas soli]KAA2236863.1 glycosyl hydrolase [Salinarimonas soli]